MARPLTVVDVLAAARAAHPQRTAYVDGDRRITYRDLDRSSSGFAAALRGHGVRPGDVVCLTLPSSIEFAIAYLGAIRTGAITSAVNQRLGARERASIVERTRPAVTVAGPTDEVADGGIVVRPGRGFHDWCATAPEADRRGVAPSEIVTVVWTSGTTGEPKGAIYDHDALRVISEGMGELSIEGDRRLVSLPFAHVGYMTRVWDDLAKGVTMVLATEPWSASEHLRLIEAERITMATGVPAQWSLVLDDERLATTDCSSLRLAGIGAAAIAPALVRAMRTRLGCPVMTRYTSTEAGLISGTRLDDPAEVVATTVGSPSPVVTVRVCDPGTGADVTATGAVGEIRVRSGAMFEGYWHDPERTAAAFDADGFLRTGDLGWVGDDGNLRIAGRLREMYIRGGYNVYPAEVEAVLCEHPGVRTAAVVGTPAPVLGEIGVAFVVPSAPDAPPVLEELREWCRARLADYKSPDRLVLLDALPVNATRKTDKQALARLAKEQA